MNRLARILVVAAFALWAAAACAERPLVLLRSDITEAFFRGNGGQYELVLSPWRAFFARQHFAAREMRATELASLTEPAVLILPSTVALSDEGRAARISRLHRDELGRRASRHRSAAPRDARLARPQAAARERRLALSAPGGTSHRDGYGRQVREQRALRRAARALRAARHLLLGHLRGGALSRRRQAPRLAPRDRLPRRRARWFRQARARAPGCAHEGDDQADVAAHSRGEGGRRLPRAARALRRHDRAAAARERPAPPRCVAGCARRRAAGLVARRERRATRAGARRPPAHLARRHEPAAHGQARHRQRAEHARNEPGGHPRLPWLRPAVAAHAIVLRRGPARARDAGLPRPRGKGARPAMERLRRGADALVAPARSGDDRDDRGSGRPAHRARRGAPGARSAADPPSTRRRHTAGGNEWNQRPTGAPR